MKKDDMVMGESVGNATTALQRLGLDAADGDVLLLVSREGNVSTHVVTDAGMWQRPETVGHCIAWYRRKRCIWRRAE